MLTAPTPPLVTGTLLRTYGVEQVVVTDCPACHAAHRHTSLGLRVPACGSPYIVQLRDAQ